MQINRRIALASLAGATIATSNAAPGVTAVDLSDPQAKLDAFVRMRCQPGGAKGYMWYEGTFFGKRHGEAAVPLLGISGFSWNRALRQTDGNYLYELQEAGYHTDLATGARVDRWQNPLNGLTVEPRHYRSGQKTRFTPERVIPAQPLPDGIDYKGTISPARVLDDMVWISEDLLVRSPNPRERYENLLEYSGPYRTSTSLATLQSPLAAVLDPDRAFTPCSLSYVTVNSWRSWMLMGEAPGTITWRLMGRKLRSPDQLGEPLRSWLGDEHPDLVGG
jgi:hypothetical protein